METYYIHIYIYNPYISYHIVRSAHEEASNAAPVVRWCSLPTPLPALPRRTGCHGSIAGLRAGLKGYLEAQLGLGWKPSETASETSECSGV